MQQDKSAKTLKVVLEIIKLLVTAVLGYLGGDAGVLDSICSLL